MSHNHQVPPGAPPEPTPAPASQQTINVNVAAPRKRTSHLFHLVLTVCTGGLWGIVWIIQTIRNRNS